MFEWLSLEIPDLAKAQNCKYHKKNEEHFHSSNKAPTAVASGRATCVSAQWACVVIIITSSPISILMIGGFLSLFSGKQHILNENSDQTAHDVAAALLNPAESLKLASELNKIVLNLYGEFLKEVSSFILIFVLLLQYPTMQLLFSYCTIRMAMLLTTKAFARASSTPNISNECSNCNRLGFILNIKYHFVIAMFF